MRVMDYYSALHIDDFDDINEEELFKRLDVGIKRLYDRKKHSSEKERKECEELIDTARRFKMVLKSYGSKENYDRALKKKTDKKVSVKKFRNIGKKAVLVATLGGVAIGGIVAMNTYDVIEVPIQEDQSIESVLDSEFDYRKLWNNKIIVKESDSDKIIEYVNNKNAEISDNDEEKDTTYSFKYIVESGDTIIGLKKRFNAISIFDEEGNTINKDIWENQTIIIKTKDKDIATDGQRLYDDIKKASEPVSFINYKVKKGDLLPWIAEEYGVTCSQIMEYNEIHDIQTIYEGQILRIPVYEKGSKTLQ